MRSVSFLATRGQEWIAKDRKVPALKDLQAVTSRVDHKKVFFPLQSFGPELQSSQVIGQKTLYKKVNASYTMINKHGC